MSNGMSVNLPAGSADHEHRPMSRMDWIAIVGGLLAMALLISGYLSADTHPAVEAAETAVSTAHHPDPSGAAHDASHHGPPAGYQTPPLWACTPFVLILLSIAVLPLLPATEHWWESNKNRLCVSLSLAGVTLLYYAFVQPMTFNHATHATYTGLASVMHVLEHAVIVEYIPFIVLLFSLYVISGGISLKGDLAAHPVTNVAFLGIGGLLASFIGTTGASMLLIRPLLQTNSQRKFKRHTVIFFIFVVSNCGGLLLPIGDPPLFLGYLRGVPFLWTLHLVWEWAVVCGALLVIYYVWDLMAYRREAPADIARDETRQTRLQLSGKLNFLFLLGIVFCVAMVDPSKPFLGMGFKPFPFMREMLMLICVGLSMWTTRPQNYRDNQFNYHAILEVAALFVGIFICMQVPIEILNQKGASLGLERPWHFFWSTGMLSAFLDNAPTYVVFFETAKVLPSHGEHAVTVAGGAVDSGILVAISLGAVFMGALSYIGNGPNFMVKSIAEQSGVRMPSFFGYMAYSFGVLVPLFIGVTLIFLL